MRSHRTPAAFMALITCARCVEVIEANTDSNRDPGLMPAATGDDVGRLVEVVLVDVVLVVGVDPPMTVRVAEALTVPSAATTASEPAGEVGGIATVVPPCPLPLTLMWPTTLFEMPTVATDFRGKPDTVTETDVPMVPEVGDTWTTGPVAAPAIDAAATPTRSAGRAAARCELIRTVGKSVGARRRRRATRPISAAVNGPESGETGRRALP